MLAAFGGIRTAKHVNIIGEYDFKNIPPEGIRLESYSRDDGITLYNDGKFIWTYNDSRLFLFEADLPFRKTGKFTKLNDELGAFKLTATDGSVAFLFKRRGNNTWFLAVYSISEIALLFFNETAAEDIRAQW